MCPVASWVVKGLQRSVSTASALGAPSQIGCEVDMSEVNATKEGGPWLPSEE